MTIIEQGRITELIFFILSAVIVWYHVLSASRGKLYPLRMLPQVQAISEGIDRSIELGRPVFATPGNLAYLSGLYAPMTINGMNIVRYTARLCVRKGARILLPVPFNPEAQPLIEGIFRQVTVEEGKPEAFNRDDIRYYGGSEIAFMVGSGADVMAYQPGLCIMVGATSSAEIYMAGAALTVGAMVIGGTPRYVHQATWACMADYPLFCDDIYAAGALCSEDNEVMASIVGGDIVKLIIMAGIVVFMILAAAGLPVWQSGTGWLFM